MNITQYRLANELASSIIQEYEKLTGKDIVAPIPVFELAESVFGLRYDIEKLKGKVKDSSGILIPGKRWIIINSRFPVVHQRFTMAHEIGHWLVDASHASNLQIIDEFTAILHKEGYSDRERIANYFAASLLIPHSLILKYGIPYWDSNKIYWESLRKIFQASKETLQLRFSDFTSTYGYPLKKFITHQSNFLNHKVHKPSYGVFNLRCNFIDHNIFRKLREAKSKVDYLYVLINRNNYQFASLFLSNDIVDGFVFIEDTNTSSLINNDTDYQFFSIDNQRFREEFEKQEKKGVNSLDLYYARDISYDETKYTQIKLIDLSHYIDHSVKLNYRKDAKDYIEEQKRLGKVVVVATGCFDILTNAHVKFLKRARQAGDILVVGLEDDSRVKKFKGESRPINTISHRVELMDALEFVDFTFVIKGAVDHDLKPYYTRLHKFIKADILAVTEGDRHLKERREEIEAAGGKLSIVSPLEDASTTSIIRKFLDEAEYKNLIIVSREELERLVNDRETTWRQLKLPLE